MMQYPGVVTLEGMLTSGLTARASWLFEGLSSDADRLSFLGVTYPNAPLNVLRQGLQQSLLAWQAAQQLQAGGGIPPLDQIPSNPNLAAANTLGVETITQFSDPNDPGKLIRIPLRIDVPDDISGDELLDYVYSQIGEHLAEGDFNQYGGSRELGAFDIGDITPTTYILAITKS